MVQLLVLDLFAGTGSATQAFADEGHEVIRVESDPKFDADITDDVMVLDEDDILDFTGGRRPDFIWASPPCTSFSVASNHLHWRWLANCYYCRGPLVLEKSEWSHREEATCNAPMPVDKHYLPKSKTAKRGIALLRHTLDLIFHLNPPWWLIENPRGLMRKMPEVEDLPRRTITHCQYGDPRRMKPTDLFGIIPEGFSARWCYQGDPCHAPVPVGSHNLGTFALKKVERAMLPPMLGEELCDLITKVEESRARVR